MEWAPFKSLSWNTNNSVAKLTISNQAAFLCETDLVIKIWWIMTAITNAKNLRQYKIRYSLIVELILALDASPKVVRGKKIYHQISYKMRHDVKGC